MSKENDAYTLSKFESTTAGMRSNFLIFADSGTEIIPVESVGISKIVLDGDRIREYNPAFDKDKDAIEVLLLGKKS